MYHTALATNAAAADTAIATPLTSGIVTPE
jgi:hypothetical protein